MSSLITHILFIGIGALLFGPIGAFAGFVLALVINSKATAIEEKWRQGNFDD